MYEFSNQKPINNRERQWRADILVGKPGQTATGRYTRNVIDAFYKFSTNEMIDLILHRTNTKIVKIGDNAPEGLLCRGNFMKETTTTKIGAFIGLLIYNELYKVNTFKIARLEIYGAPILSTTMSWNRFFFHSYKPFVRRRRNSWKQDRFTASRELLELFNKQCSKYLRESDYLWFDETLYSTRNEISFKQFNPNKLAKYRLLFNSINAVEYLYTFVTAPYSRNQKMKVVNFIIHVQRVLQSISLNTWLHPKV